MHQLTKDINNLKELKKLVKDRLKLTDEEINRLTYPQLYKEIEKIDKDKWNKLRKEMLKNGWIC